MTRKSVGPSTNQSKSEIYNSSAEFNNQNNNEKNDVKLPSKLDVIKNRIQKLARRASFKDFGGSQSLSSSLKDLSTIEEIIQQEPSDERTVYCNAFAQRVIDRIRGSPVSSGTSIIKVHMQEYQKKIKKVVQMYKHLVDTMVIANLPLPPSTVDYHDVLFDLELD